MKRSLLSILLVLSSFYIYSQCIAGPGQDCGGGGDGPIEDPIDPGDGGGDPIGGGGGSNFGAPTALEETNRATTQFMANWNAVSGAIAYRIDVATNSNFTSFVSGFNNKLIGGDPAGGGGGLLGPEGGDPVETYIMVTGLSPGRNYYYRVRAVSVFQTSGSSNTITANTSIGAPTAQQESNRQNTSFTARWGSVSGASYYKLDVSSSSNFSSGNIYSGLNVSSTTRSITGLTPGRNYYYRVRAVGPNVTSSYSGTITANTSISSPSKIEEADRTNTSFTARWGSVTGASYYKLDVSTSSNFSSGNLYSGLNVSSTTRSITGLTPGKNYYYRVRAVGAHHTSSYSSTVTANTSISVPARISEDTRTTTSFRARWGGVTGAQSYRLDVSTTSNFSSMVSGYSNLGVGNTTNHIVDGLTPGKNYYYRVRAIGSHVTSGNSSTEAAYTSIAAPVVSQESSNAPNSFRANWGSVSGAQSYRLDVSSTSNFSAMVAGYNNLNVGNTTYTTVSGLEPGRNYYYRVRAIGVHHASGNSSYTTANTTMTTPTVLDGSDQANTSFTANWGSVSGAQSYVLAVSLYSDFQTRVDGYDYVNVGNVTSKPITGLIPGKNYYYKVRAQGLHTASGLSGYQKTNTTIAAPVPLEETNKELNSFTANWNAVNGALTYTVQVSQTSDFSSVLQEVSVINTSANITGVDLSSIIHYYRVKAIGQNNVILDPDNPDGDVISSDYSSVITVHSKVVAGTISYGGLVCAGDSPGLISGTPAAGGDGVYEYEWQYHNGTGWQPIANSNQEDYDPSLAISSDTPFRRNVRSDGGDWESSNELTIAIYDVITDIGTLSVAENKVCPDAKGVFTYVPAAGVDVNQTRLIGQAGSDIVDFGNITGERSIYVKAGYQYYVAYQQPCVATDVQTNAIAFSFYDNCNVPPSLDQNFVRTEVPKVPVNSQYDLSILDPRDKLTSYAYSDGLGRPTMSVGVEAGQNFEDVVQFSVYNAEGRQEKSYMSYSHAPEVPGAYQDTVVNKDAQSNFYQSGNLVAQDTKPFSKTTWDARGRVKSVVAPGEAWHANDKKTTYNYDVFDPALFDGTSTSLQHADVIKWDIVNGLPVQDGTYATKELAVTMVTDVEDRKSRQATDTRGLAITSQIYDASQSKWVGSYQVYDELGRVRFTIPPMLAAITAPTQAQVDELAFQYEYDYKGRVIRERAPGAGWVEYVYDHWNRLVLTRHAAQVKDGNNYWTYFKYDALNRQVMTGEVQIPNATTRENLQEEVLLNTADNQRFETRENSALGYSDDATFPSGPGYTLEPLTVNYFDDYDFITYTNWDAEGQDFSLSVPAGFNNFGWAPEGYTLVTGHITILGGAEDLPGGGTGGPTVHNGKYAIRGDASVTLGDGVTAGPGFEVITAAAAYDNVVDLSTGSKVRILGTDTWLNTVVYYDARGRVIQTISENHKGGADRLTNDLDWKGELQKMLLQHNSATESADILSEYEYAHNGQLLKTYQTIDGGDRVLVGDYHYNVLGELVEKNLHSLDGTSFLQSVDYRYNLQGAMTRINNADLSDAESDLFGMEYHYETGIDINGLPTTPRYDGIVNAMVYGVTNATSTNTPTSGPQGVQTAVGFSYDDQTRLSNTAYATASVTGTFDQQVNHFSMNVAGYDDNGNIQALNRKADGEAIDDLTYTYQTNSNKLKSVDDGSSNARGMDDPMASGGTITEYQYDAMGNNTSDVNKKIQTITYNLFQLVESIEFTDGSKVAYTYDAARNRLAKEVLDADNNSVAKVDYVGLVEYLDDEINQLFTNEGRAYKQNGTYHYEYFITDHQGNNRVAFGNLPERNIYIATMELTREVEEESNFNFPNDHIRSSIENHTPLGAGSIALNGTLSGREIGPSKVLTISAGDEVELEVWAKYNTAFADNTPVSDIASVILNAFNAAGASTGLEGQGSALSGALGSGSSALFANSQSQEPRAYLQYLFFDESYNFIESGSGFKEVTDLSLGKFAKYESGKLTYNQTGYLFVYLVNETSENKDVFFDDLKITHSSSDASFKVSQVNDFYPFGLPTSNSWRSPGYIDPGLLYQSSYASYDSLTGYYDFLSRSYDPVLGRFFAVDPAGQFSSPYAGMGNIPHFGTDPDGEWFFAALGIAAKIYGAASTAVNVYKGFEQGGFHGGLSAIASAGIGAVTSKIGTEIIGALDIKGIVPGALAGAGVQGTLSGAVTAASGGDFWSGFKGGAISGGIQGGIQGYHNSMGSDRGILFGDKLKGDRLLARHDKFLGNLGVGTNLAVAYEYTGDCCGGQSDSGTDALGVTGVGLGAADEVADLIRSGQTVVVPVMNESGKAIAGWNVISKQTGKVLEYVKAGTTRAGYLTAGLGVAFDTYDLVNGDISVGRFSYHTIGTAASIAAGSAASGGIGALVGGIFILGEHTYDLWVNEALPIIRNAIPSGSALRFPVRR